MTSPAVRGLSADSSRLEASCTKRLCRRSWSTSDWRETYKSQSSTVFLGKHWWWGSRQCQVDRGRDLELDVLPHWKPVQLVKNWWNVVVLQLWHNYLPGTHKSL